ncbi:MAG TPA: ATP-binding protein [Acidimicrobiales bacterium]|nr:ATP-binding protein [Acidimicrobiales bacterium]
MEIRIGLSLPREARTISVARHICRETLRELGVEGEGVSDIEVALTEACTNVLDHSGPGDEYDVELSLTDRLCVIRVVDTGHGFDPMATPAPTDERAESGRGIHLMKALVDCVRFESRPEDGTIVHLEKELAFVEGAPGPMLSLGRSSRDGS